MEKPSRKLHLRDPRPGADCQRCGAAVACSNCVVQTDRSHARYRAPAASFFRPLRQVIESVNDTFKGQLDLERHGGRTPEGVTVRILQPLLALTAAIWHNDHTGQPVMRSLIAYDH